LPRPVSKTPPHPQVSRVPEPLASRGPSRTRPHSPACRVPGAKVYARKHGGAVAFYKDGYTDLRGWFDYASLSTTGLEHVERFAIVVCSDRPGAEILEAAPPVR
jgi:hypothetical protein